jgi:hypothetical protein
VRRPPQSKDILGIGAFVHFAIAKEEVIILQIDQVRLGCGLFRALRGNLHSQTGITAGSCTSADAGDEDAVSKYFALIHRVLSRSMVR